MIDAYPKEVEEQMQELADSTSKCNFLEQQNQSSRCFFAINKLKHCTVCKDFLRLTPVSLMMVRIAFMT